MPIKRLSVSANEDNYFEDSKPKIDLVSCHLGNDHCNNYLSEVNKDFLHSRQYRTNKDYIKSIEHLKNAYNNTFDKKEDACFKCAAFFRSTIIESMENLYEELRSLSSGFFRTKRYQSSFIMAESVLKELKNKTD